MSANIEYTPPPTVSEFIESEQFYNFIIGPVGSAKTTGILFKIVYHATRQRPSPVDSIRRSRWVVVRNTLPQLKDTTINSFMTWFKHGEAGRWISSTNTFVFKFGDVEAEVLFRPLDTPDDVSRVLSLEVTGAILDEFVEIPKEVVEALSGRCGRYPSAKDGGPTWWGMWGASNPGNEDIWWHKWLYDDWEGDVDGSEKRNTLAYFEQPSGFSDDAENIDNLPGNRGYYENLAKGKSAQWVKQFIEVRWGYSLRGKPVYNAFSPDVHVAKKTLIYNPRLPVYMGFDAGLTPASAFGQLDPHGRLLLLGELVSDNMGARRFCREMIVPYIARRFPGCELIVAADPAVNQRAQTDERSVAQVLREELQVPVKPAFSNTLVDRLGAVDDYLTRLVDGVPAFLIDPNECRVIIRGFTSGYRYPVSNKGIKGDSPEKNAYSHPHDAVQYLCMATKTEVSRAARLKSVSHMMRPVSNPYVFR